MGWFWWLSQSFAFGQFVLYLSMLGCNLPFESRDKVCSFVWISGLTHRIFSRDPLINETYNFISRLSDFDRFCVWSEWMKIKGIKFEGMGGHNVDTLGFQIAGLLGVNCRVTGRELPGYGEWTTVAGCAITVFTSNSAVGANVPAQLTIMSSCWTRIFTRFRH